MMRGTCSHFALLVACVGLLGSLCLPAGATAQVDPRFRPEHGYWSEGEPRWFVSQRSELGALYFKPYVSAGYGMPHWIWTGVDVNAIATLEMAQAYFGVHAGLPVFDLAIGMRDTWSFQKPFLTPASRYSRSDLLDAKGASARYWAFEVEAVGILPLPHAALLADLILVRTLDVPKHMYVYDESYRAVVASPLFFTLRAAAVVRVLAENVLRVGVLSEFVLRSGRSEIVMRLGPAASLQLTDHVEVNAALSLAVISPDRLGLVLGAYGVAGVRYRWASGEARPSWPWQGELIP